ncbi:putative F-box protein [Arabidopsis thaliana]|uniref:F-box domain-containing protein n=2 Tax=Arabidopsis TaxID=3701 RepID=A0A178W4C3_ARATH|nr:F-box domain [Arabidopsis thaliana x Arabidopsis arenosa]OAP13108.1 hypothetical protein AXX17_AT1G65140 [Arabidopsis thaliana]
MVNTSFETLPRHMQMEILSRVPLKFLMKFMCVSKKWASIIRGEEFREDYLFQSMKRPRVLFVIDHREYLPIKPEAFFHSVYQEDQPLLLSGKLRMRTFETPLVQVFQPIRGLICQQGYGKIVICNPGLKKFRSLPQIKVHKGAPMRTFFGYDEDKDVFKVLCITWLRNGKRSEVSKEYLVYTMGSDEESSSWRLITCEHDHAPVTEGLFKGGVLYYGAKSNNGKSVVMSFNVNSEDFSVIELEVEISPYWRLVNYKGDIALMNNIEDSLYHSREFEMWVRNEVTGNWDRTSIKISHWNGTVDGKTFYFKGTIGTKELAFAPDYWFGEQHFVSYYDTETKNLRRFDIEGMVDQDDFVRTFFDHVDSTWLI